MTEDEKAIAIAKRVEAHEKAIEDRKEQEIKDGFLNPFGEETSYAEFQKELTKSKLSLEEYCKDKLTDSEISWLKKDLEIYTNRKKK